MGQKTTMDNTNVTSQPVSSIMTKDIFKVTVENSLKEVNKMFAKYHIRHVPVVDDEKLVGILSLTDVQRLSFRDSFNDDPNIDSSIADMLTVEQVMKHDPVTVDQNDPIMKAAEILTTAEFHALPVVSEGKLVGIVTTTDIIKHLIQQA